jgi:hypothetical protein
MKTVCESVGYNKSSLRAASAQPSEQSTTITGPSFVCITTERWQKEDKFFELADALLCPIAVLVLACWSLMR